ncbi:MAG: hypothetical protein JW827_11290 [Spirochaetes bacterium]|nr:hypothetical protein [Spirochaetota bacterium]
MRLWSIHPKYLDTRGLVAAWREGLLAFKVLKGHTRAYQNHPQLERFKRTNDPLLYLNTYLIVIYQESVERGYHFNKNKLGEQLTNKKINIKKGQILFEFRHLMKKVFKRDPTRYRHLKNIKKIQPHPLFQVIPGKKESWEKGSDG